MNKLVSADYFGVFHLPLHDFSTRWQFIKAFIFDWDGVFNNGHKDEQGGSSYSEIDSMGTNLLRLSHYFKNGQVPIVAVISGENNPMAQKLCKRENFTALYGGVKNKVEAMEHLCAQHNLHPNEIAFVFDDVLDFSIAQACGLRMMITDESKPTTTSYALEQGLVDYISKHTGGNGAIREICELGLELNNNAREIFTIRTEFQEDYQEYLKARSAVQAIQYTVNSAHEIVLK